MCRFFFLCFLAVAVFSLSFIFFPQVLFLLLEGRSSDAHFVCCSVCPCSSFYAMPNNDDEDDDLLNYIFINGVSGYGPRAVPWPLDCGRGCGRDFPH